VFVAIFLATSAHPIAGGGKRPGAVGQYYGYNQRVPYYAGKREQERLVAGGPVRWSIGPDMAGEVLLPGDGARLGPTTFDDWLAGGAR
jgi:hypothetical protein